SNIREIEFCLITTIKSYSYIEFHLNQSLENYNLWVAQQKVTDDNIKLYLIDTLNNIVMAGDITIYPFLKDEYIRKFKNEK
ncbi:MAG: hypothetical protein KAU46_00860, partial [Candidatus Aminicenantes bacterium]|nr:hypothetical protein [Candidatus Aminicenantes bacterium]